MSRTRSSAFPTSQSAPSTSSMREPSERRNTSHKGRRAKELTCESCGKHPVCLQKHRWEHNPLWRDTAQLLLSKHQQVQVMEAAAILLHGTSLPPDRSLWPSYMSGGTLPSPGFAEDPSATTTTRDATPQFRRAASPTESVVSSAHDDAPSTSQFDDDELEEISEDEEEEDEENTDESDVPVPPTAHGRERSQSVGLAAPVQSHMPNLAGSYGVGSHMLPSSLVMPAYGWGVITESGQYGNAYGPKSPISESHISPRSPVAINQHPHLQQSQHHHHRSLSSFSSFSHSFGSSTSSYIPSSSLRSSSDVNGDDDDEDMREGMQDVQMHDDDDEEEEFDYNFQRATTLCRRLTAVPVKSHARGDSSGNTAAAASSSYNDDGSSSNKSISPERRRDEDMYELEMDMD